MTTKQAVSILAHHQKWRQGAVQDMDNTPREISEAIDMVLAAVATGPSLTQNTQLLLPCHPVDFVDGAGDWVCIRGSWGSRGSFVYEPFVAPRDFVDQNIGRPSYIPVTPVPAPRMTQRDRWRNETSRRRPVQRYFDYRDIISIAWAQNKITKDPSAMGFCFMFEPTDGYCRKNKIKREDVFYTPRELTPDNDNLIKAVKDAVMPKDEGVHAYLGVAKIFCEKMGVCVITSPKNT